MRDVVLDDVEGADLAGERLDLSAHAEPADSWRAARRAIEARSRRRGGECSRLAPRVRGARSEASAYGGAGVLGGGPAGRRPESRGARHLIGAAGRGRRSRCSGLVNAISPRDGRDRKVVAEVVRDHGADIGSPSSRLPVRSALALVVKDAFGGDAAHDRGVGRMAFEEPVTLGRLGSVNTSSSPKRRTEPPARSTSGGSLGSRRKQVPSLR